MKFAICNEIFEGWPWPEVCRFVKEVGYDGIELAPFTFAGRVTDISSATRREIRKTAEDAGLSIVGLHWILAKTEGFHLNHPEQTIRRKTADYLMALADLCADLGGELMVFGSPQQRTVLPGLTFSQAWDFAKETFRLVLPHLERLQIPLCLEPLSTKETDFISSTAQGREFVQQMSHPNFRLHLDVKAMSWEDSPVATQIRENADLLGHFHANDPNLGGPGFGEVEFGPILAALEEVRYSGFVSVEVFDFTPGPERIARESLRYLREKQP